MGALGLCSTSWKQEQLVSKCPWGYSRDADQGHVGMVQPACRVLVACMITIFVFVFNFKYLPKCGCQHNSPENPDFCLHLTEGCGPTGPISYKAEGSHWWELSPASHIFSCSCHVVRPGPQEPGSASTRPTVQGLVWKLWVSLQELLIQLSSSSFSFQMT